MKDLSTRNDLEVLMNSFYQKLLQDASINYIFTEIAQINLEKHLPILVDFWQQTLFNIGGYKNNVLQIHLDLNAKISFSEEHFETWLNHFNQTVNELFIGENAEKIKTRALSIATVMKIKMAKKIT
ncbi:group III truncated hemoglobin [Flavobacterium sp.]|uniref:group III truncated hemoglobin n=1 Tax=Flavobacterium sp. TaxID=239 RepID=UPI002B4B12EB|nr:group III truncated hemoglobin [Flavobacterium sp.]HLF50807.1 group III truncated hemoglobin [Flavobacterium sp.]